MLTLPVLWTLIACGPPAAPGDDALDALESDAFVTVTNEDAIWFEPTTRVADVGLVFYPGGKVDAEAYAPVLRRIAEAGYPVWVVRVAFDLAILSPGRADTVINVVDDVDTWVVGGHSLGGVSAAVYADGHLDVVKGLALWAATPPDDRDLTDSGLAVSSLFASNDGLFVREDWEASFDLLPADTVKHEIVGGNHAGFGDYGDQADDLEATITPEDQWDETASYTVDLLERVTP